MHVNVLYKIAAASPNFSDHHPDQSAAINMGFPSAATKLRLAEGLANH